MATEWWKTAVIYQIYPRSFQDSNGDGVGDLNGIRRRLPYLAALGVDAVWGSPFYKSPMADFGYDVADYYDVDPRFGTLADCRGLIAEAHALGLKVILDFVPNHTSDQHPWFIESRSSRQNPKRDWYLWKDARPGGGAPNNWMSYFGGSAWDGTTFQASTTTTPSLRSSPISIGATMRSAPRCMKCSAFGWSSAWMGFAST